MLHNCILPFQSLIVAFQQLPHQYYLYLHRIEDCFPRDKLATCWWLASHYMGGPPDCSDTDLLSSNTSTDTRPPSMVRLCVGYVTDDVSG